VAVRRVGVLLLVPVLAVAGACGSGTTGGAVPPATAGSPAPGRTVSLDVAGRPFRMYVPSSYRAGSAVPLVVALHGYSSSAVKIEAYFRLATQSDRRGFLYATPDGRTDHSGNQYWNATDACCDFDDSGVDDSAYLSQLIAAVRRAYSVNRVFLIGHSNGAFMAIRMACEHADQITAIVGLNGAMWNDATRCRPSRPVSFLDIRSTADDTIRYGGGYNGPGYRARYPSAATTDEDWRGFDRCQEPDAGRSLDIVTNLAGAETDVTPWSCAEGSTVVSWRINGGTHSPALSAAFAAGVVDFMYAQAAS
jgi:polyhydroxybutyrate depolymerase